MLCGRVVGAGAPHCSAREGEGRLDGVGRHALLWRSPRQGALQRGVLGSGFRRSRLLKITTKKKKITTQIVSRSINKLSRLLRMFYQDYYTKCRWSRSTCAPLTKPSGRSSATRCVSVQNDHMNWRTLRKCITITTRITTRITDNSNCSSRFLRITHHEWLIKITAQSVDGLGRHALLWRSPREGALQRGALGWWFRRSRLLKFTAQIVKITTQVMSRLPRKLSRLLHKLYQDCCTNCRRCWSTCAPLMKPSGRSFATR